jgi:DNA polymerase-3 subunit epsilon
VGGREVRDHLLDGTFVAIDVETTGFDVEHAEIIDIGAVRVEGGIITESFSSLVDPGFFIPQRIKELTGITNAMIVGSPGIKEVLPRFLDFVGDSIIVGHNVYQDIKFINKYTRTWLGYRFKRPHICTLQLSRRVLPELKAYSLKEVADHLGIHYDRLHRALDDATTTANLFLALLGILWERYGIDDYFSIRRLAKTGRFA